MMFGGDDVGAVVLDMGSNTSKVGFASRDMPQAVYPTAVGLIAKEGKKESMIKDDELLAAVKSKSNGRVGTRGSYFVGNQTVTYRRESMNIIRPVVESLIVDFDAMQHVYDHAFDSCLHIDSSEHPILLSDPISNTKDRREKLCQLMFEHYKTPAVFLASSPVLSAFSVGKTTALIMELGSSLTTCVPVFEGFSLRRSVRRTRMAGDFLDVALEQWMTKNHTIVPAYRLNKKWNDFTQSLQVTTENYNVTDSYARFMTTELFRDMKENVCRIADVASFDINAPPFLPTTTYELPDSNTITVGSERFSVPELLFNPSHYDLPVGDVDSEYRFPGLVKMTQDTINSADVDLRRELYSNVVPVGGTALLPGLVERLQKQLSTAVSSSIKVRLHGPGSNVERQFSTWVGGSILGSLGSFQQMWISKAEYEEYGASIVDKKCP